LDERAWVSVFFGGLVLVAAYLIDLRGRSEEDYAFWWYLFGLLAFWGGLTDLHSDSEVGKAIYFLINLGLICVALFLRRRVFLVFGALGAFLYLGHLAWTVFKDSMMFPLVLTPEAWPSSPSVCCCNAGARRWRRGSRRVFRRHCSGSCPRGRGSGDGRVLTILGAQDLPQLRRIPLKSVQSLPAVRLRKISTSTQPQLHFVISAYVGQPCRQ